MQTSQNTETTQGLVKKCATNEKEKEYLGTLELYENKELRDVIKKIKLKGLDPVDILKEAYEAYEAYKGNI